MAILIDSSVLCAHINNRDVHNKKAQIMLKEILSNKYAKPIITDYIFDESVTVTQRKTNKKIAVNMGIYLLNSEFFMVRIDQSVFRKAWDLFKKPNTFSFTDCTNVAFMQIFGINKIATFDKEFKKMKSIKVVD